MRSISSAACTPFALASYARCAPRICIIASITETFERSNVSIVEAMMQILGAQRAYEANAKGVQAADEMLRIANNLHRG